MPIVQGGPAAASLTRFETARAPSIVGTTTTSTISRIRTQRQLVTGPPSLAQLDGSRARTRVQGRRESCVRGRETGIGDAGAAALLLPAAHCARLLLWTRSSPSR